MRKIYAFIAAALMSASMFAAAPTAAEIAAAYDITDNVVFVIEFIDDAEVCNDIRFVGTPNNWGKGEGESESWDNCEKFAPVEGHEGWYAAELPYSEGFQGKPLQEPSDRSWTWDFQCGDMDAWVHVDGLELTLEAGYAGECNIKAGAAGAYIYQLKYWKNHKSPCVAAIPHTYTVTLYAPDACEDMKPAIIGDFNGWKQGVPMVADLDDDFNDIYTYTFTDIEGHGFKIKEVDDTDWTNQMQFYNDTADAWWTFDNYELTADSNIVLDWGDNDKYRFALCNGEPIDTTSYPVIVVLEAPAGAPAAVEIIGTFDGWSGTALTLVDGAWGTVLPAIKAADQFKFREAGNWDNQIQYNGENMDNIVFGEVWVDGALMGEAYADYKIVAADFSGEGFAWTTPTEGIENVVLTEKAQKIMVDGVIYIIRDNKMFNVQGTQVR